MSSLANDAIAAARSQIIQNNNENNDDNIGNPPSLNDDLDPATFLRSVRELSEKREREDAERYRRLEEEVEKSRAERAARRAERARSLSPEKMADAVQSPHSNAGGSKQISTTSPLNNTPTLSATHTSPATQKQNPPSPTKDIPEFTGFGTAQKSEEKPSPSPSSQSASSDMHDSPSRPSATSLARSGTLSWQQRPRPQSGARPISMYSSLGSPNRSRVQSREQSVEQPDPSRDQIAASLASRDPAWFRQTPDRGVANAAYRKSREENTPGESLTRRGLPGLSRDTSMEPEVTASPTWSESNKTDVSVPTSLRNSTYAKSRVSANSTGASTPTKPDLKSLVVADAAQLQASPMSVDRDPTSSLRSDNEETRISMRTPTMSTAQARILQGVERPTSPTKGVGGFVQSAMLKRSDSVSKRWSVQAGPGVASRQETLSHARDSIHASQSMPKMEPSDAQIQSNTESEPPQPCDPDKSLVTKRSMPLQHTRNKSFTSVHNFRSEDGLASPPASPPKRWSPTKASWIESALNKPDTPKITPAKNAQPSWMAGIAKAKAQRASADVTSMLSASSTAVHNLTSPIKSTFVPDHDSDKQPASTPTVKPKPAVVDPVNSRAKLDQLAVVEEPVKTLEAYVPTSEQVPLQSEAAPIAQMTTDRELSSTATSDNAQLPRAKLASPSVPQKPIASQKPNLDFRSNLRSRPPAEPRKDDTPEFLAKFGNLRRAQTDKYVAPDTLKDNITRGKAELTKTGGPIKTVRRDELKESLLEKKEDMRKAKEEGRDLPGQIHEKKTNNGPIVAAKPEALAKLELLSKSSIADSDEGHSRSDRNETSEALERLKSIKSSGTKRTNPVQSTDDKDFKINLQPLTKQTSLPATLEVKGAESSKLAARFNPGLASFLARGPPSAPTTRSQSPAPLQYDNVGQATVPPVAVTPDTPLQDMRKDRAKGPKKRKQANAIDATSQISREPITQSVARPSPEPKEDLLSTSRSAPGSAASLMVSSLRASRNGESDSKPASIASARSKSSTATRPTEVTEFSGFGTPKKNLNGNGEGENGENTSDKQGVGSIASIKTKQPIHSTTPAQTQLPSQKDEEAAMKSAGLLASTSIRTTNVTTAAAGERPFTLPPKPSKSSRVVSGQVHDGAPGKSVTTLHPRSPDNAAVHFRETLSLSPRQHSLLIIDMAEVLSSCTENYPNAMLSLRNTVYELATDHALHVVPKEEEHIFFDSSIYLCHQAMHTQKDRVLIWKGTHAPVVDDMIVHAARQTLACQNTPDTDQLSQGHEPFDLIQQLGGILITRLGKRVGASKQYLLRGRKHLGGFVFDEVSFSNASLCSGYTHLISHPVTLQKINFYLWKGSACSIEEVSAARLAAMGLSYSGEITEVEEGSESTEFWNIFGPKSKRASQSLATSFWQQKALDPKSFAVRLFRIQPVEVKTGLISSLFQRPSWSSLSPSRSPVRGQYENKIEAKHISPFVQEDLEADGVYILDVNSKIYVLIGPLFKFAVEKDLRSHLFVQALEFAIEYTSTVFTIEKRAVAPKSQIVLAGTPSEAEFVFRHWNSERGLWGTSGLMAGSTSASRATFKSIDVEDMLTVMYNTDGIDSL